MTTIDTHVGAATRASSSGSPLLGAVADWVTSGDHKRIGRLFVGFSLLFAVGSAVVGALLGFERMQPQGLQLVPGDSIVQLLSVYRFGLVFAVLSPLFVGLAVAVVPLQVGSRAISFPRLAQSGFWMWLFGVVLVIVSIVGNGGPGGGSTDLVDLYLLGLGLVMVGILAASLSVATTVLTSRAPGMTLDLVPAFSWSALVGSVATLLTLPVALGTIVYLYVDHTHAKVAFGGNKDIDKWLGWVTSQPQTFVFIVMALGVLAEVAPVAARGRQPMRFLVLVGTGLVSTSALGAVTQSSHVLAWTGSLGDKVKSAVPFLLFNGLPVLGVLVVVGAALLALKEGKPRIASPLLFATVGSLFVLAGVAGHFVASISSASLAGTSFDDGIVLYVVLGGLLCALGGLTHWSPKLWGRVLDEKKVIGLVGLGAIGTIAAALPLYVAGFADQPAGVVDDFDYSGPIGLWNSVSAVGLAVVILMVVAFAGLLARSVAKGEQAADDPWDAHTLEWSVPSPAPLNNFDELVTVSSSEPLLDAKPAPQEVSS